MRNQLVILWPGSPSAFGYRMGWLRALLGQKLQSLSRSFAALLKLFVRFGYPNLARGVLVFWQRCVLTITVLLRDLLTSNAVATVKPEDKQRLAEQRAAEITKRRANFSAANN